jgi:hypothetical protein
MDTRTKALGVSVVSSALVLLLVAEASQAGVETARAANGAETTKISTNGRSAFALLSAGDTNGFLNASYDEIADTSALDFAYATPDGTDPDLVILIAGAGEIPNEAFTITRTTAHLTVTTPFLVTRCVVSLETGFFDCAPGSSVTFDLVWARSGISTVLEKTKRVETLGPVITKFHGEYEQLSASVSGTWDAYAAADMFGELFDSKGTTLVREMTIKSKH